MPPFKAPHTTVGRQQELNQIVICPAFRTSQINEIGYSPPFRYAVT